jgi:hypothetical protein
MLIADVSCKSAVTDLRDPAFDGLSDAEWSELTELVFTCADDRLASVVFDIAGITPETQPTRASRQKCSATRALLAGEEFYRTLLQELRRRIVD